VPFVKEMLITVLNVLILDKMPNTVMNVQKVNLMMESMLIVNPVVITIITVSLVI
jgi:hypothetical protein